MKKYNLGEFNNTVIDTLELSRALDTGFARHSLSALVKRYNVPFDEESHHRADYDAEGTAFVFNKMISKLENEKIYNVNELQNLVSKEELFKFGRTYHFNAIAKDRVGLKNLFTLTDRYPEINTYTNYQKESNYFIDVSIQDYTENDEISKKNIWYNTINNRSK